MTNPGAPLYAAVRILALTIAELEDFGWDFVELQAEAARGLPTHEQDPELVEDLLMAATSLLAGINPDLPGLAQVWDGVALVPAANR